MKKYGGFHMKNEAFEYLRTPLYNEILYVEITVNKIKYVLLNFKI